MKVDIIIVNWNSADDTLRCLASVLPQSQRRNDVRVTVVDNGSVDDSVSRIGKEAPRVRVISLSANRGFTGGIGAGVGVADAEYLIFLNNDTVVESGWLDHFVSSLDQAPDDVIALSGKMLDPAGQRIDFIGGSLTFDGHAFQNDFRKPMAEVSEPAAGAELLFACGGNMIVRRASFLQLGGFDDDYFAYLEDVDFGWRSWLAGFRILYEPEALARHKSSATSDRLGAFERGVLFERNALQTATKNFDDTLFAAAMAPVLLASMHRLHRYLVDRNAGSAWLTTPPLGSASGGDAPTRSFWDRLLRREGTKIVDPLTRMQIRSTEWFFRNSERIMRKRAEVQKMRQRSDKEIFERFPLHYVPTYAGDEALFSSSLFRALRLNVTSIDRPLEDMIRS